MRPIILLALICMSYTAHSADNETTAKKKVTHHVQFLFGNYVSESALYQPMTNFKTVYTPLYSYSVGFDYKVDFSEYFGLRTGINYFTDGVWSKQTQITFSMPNLSIKKIFFTSSILIPIHFIAYKPLRKGRFVFSVGADIYLPTNTFGKQTLSGFDGEPNGTTTIHSRPNYQNYSTGGSLGFTVGIGYEKKISDKLSVEFLPDFRLLNAVPFNFDGTLANESIPPYSFYTFNMALGLSTYITFY